LSRCRHRGDDDRPVGDPAGQFEIAGQQDPQLFGRSPLVEQLVAGLEGPLLASRDQLGSLVVGQPTREECVPQVVEEAHWWTR
jgi:hypothetical protein